MTPAQLQMEYTLRRVYRTGVTTVNNYSGAQMQQIVRDYLAALGSKLSNNASLSAIHAWLAADLHECGLLAHNWRKERVLKNPMMTLR